MLEAFQLIEQIELTHLVLRPGDGKIRFCGGGSLVNLQPSLLRASTSSLLHAQPFWRATWQPHGLSPPASHTASAFMVIFAVPFEALGNCLLCQLLKLMHGVSPVWKKILLLEKNYLRYNVCWENICQKVKLNTQLSCKSAWYHLLIKYYYWEVVKWNKQKKLLLSAVCLHACAF